jgi:hypothetical protein
MDMTRYRSRTSAYGIAGFIAACLFALSIGLNAARAQAPEADPPGRVARVAETIGQVWLYSPDAGEWIAAVRNRPVTTGDRLATDAGARVELDLGSTTLRLDSDSEVEVQRLDDSQVALLLHNGSAGVRVRDAQAVAEFEIATEEGRMSLLAPGAYRFDRFDRSSHLTVYFGQARYEGPGSALTVDAGQRGQFWIEANGAAQYSVTEPARDAFATWNGERDREQDRVAAARFVSPEMTGARDLDRYGRWEQSPEYGAIWFPRSVARGWAPYSTGHWAWVRPWGWTWVDDAPWGFAPFHYGRWVYYRNAWCWAPGTFVRRPVYAPALVAWVGGPGANASISIRGGPAVGWFPLAPREVYVPAYRVSPRYVRDINYTHVRNIPNVGAVIGNPNSAQRDYANRKYPHAVTVVPANVLSNREPVAPNAARFRELPEVRAIVNEPSRVAAMLTPPVPVAPAVAPRGLEARPFRQPGDAGRGPRFERPQGNAGDDGRRAPAVAAQPVPVPNPADGSRRGAVAAPTIQPGATEDRRGGPQMRAAPDDRRGRDRRDGGMTAQSVPNTPAPSVAPPVVPPAVGGAPGILPRPTPMPQQAAPAAPAAPVAPVAPAAVAPPARVAPAAPTAVAPPAPVAPVARTAPPQALPQPGVERRRERDFQRSEAPAPARLQPRADGAANPPPAQPRMPPPSAQAQAPRPIRAEPTAAPPQAAPAVRPAEAPRARPPGPEGRGEPHRGEGRPGGPPGRGERP